MIFSIENLELLSSYFHGLLGGLNLPLVNNSFIYYLTNYGLFLLVGIIFCFPVGNLIPDKIKDNGVICIIRGICYIILFIISICFIVSDTYNPFLYFRF